MINNIFLKTIDISCKSIAVILLVLLFRLLIKKAPKIFSYALWLIVFFRLACPAIPQSSFSLIPDSINNIIPMEIIGHISSGLSDLQGDMRLYDNYEAYANSVVSDNIGMIDNPNFVGNNDSSINNINHNDSNANKITSVGTMQSKNSYYMSSFWLAGMLALLLYSIFSYVVLARRLRFSARLRDNIYECEHINSPFVFGIIKPRIYLPVSLKAEELDYVILHEQIHINRYDHIVRLICYLILCVHWFNPLVWLAFYLMCNDMEMSCDEAVIRKLGPSIKKIYSASLLSLSTGRLVRCSIPLSFGEDNIKNRIKNVLSYKKPALYIIIILVILTAVLACGLITNPKSNDDNNLKTSIWNYRTLYIGNNSKVGGIAYGLDYPSGIYCDTIALQTDNPPYELTINLKANEGSADYKSKESEAMLQLNACIVFSLVENADIVTFNINDNSSEAYTVSYTSEWAENITGTDLWSASEEYTSFIEVTEKSKTAIDSALGLSNRNNDIDRADRLDKAVTKAIMDRNNIEYERVNFKCESHIILSIEEAGFDNSTNNPEKVTVYAMVLHQDYNISDKGITDEGGSHIPTAITFNIDKNGDYILDEYWIPRDGSYYVKDIKNKFPKNIAKKAMDTQLYILDQIQSCYNQAVQYANLDTDSIIEALVDKVMEGPATLSNPMDYVNNNSIDFRELTYYGDYTLAYCFNQFNNQEQTGLKGHIMALACQSIIRDYEDVDFEYSNGQEWFNLFFLKARDLKEKYDIETIKEKHPKVYLLLKSVNEV